MRENEQYRAEAIVKGKPSKADRLKNDAKSKLLSETKIAKEVSDDLSRRSEERRGLESIWLLNFNFYLGNQYAEILPSGEIEDLGKQYFWQQREVYNHIAPIVETRLAKFTRISPSATVRPATGDEADINAAKFTTKLLRSVQDEVNLQKLKNTANFYSELTGSAFYKLSWNSDGGKTVGMVDDQMIAEGNVEITICPPYEIYPDNLCAGDVENCVSLIHAKAYPIAEAERLYGKKFKGDTISVLNFGAQNNQGGNGYRAQNSRAFQDKKENHVLIIERYEKPIKGYPNGRLLIVAEDQVLFDGELPYCIGDSGDRGFPFVKQAALDDPSSFFGSSVVERIIPVQRAYNAVKNRKHEFLNRISMGVMSVEDGSIDLDNLETEGLSPGKVLTYRQGARPPEMMGQPSVPSDFREEELSLLKEFLSVSGVSDLMTNSSLVSNSNVSGVALSLLIEQDDTRLALSAASIKNALRRVGQYIIRLFRQFASEPRLARIGGDNGEMELASFVGSELNSDDLVFMTENDISDTPANRKNMVVELLKLGLLTDDNGKIDKNGKAKVLEMMGFGNWESARETEALHRRRAEEENLNADTNALKILEIDDHEIHITEHIKAMISKEYSLTDGGRSVLNKHIREHKRYERLTQMAELDMGQEAQDGKNN